jgi:hypothetical protein
MLVAEVVRVTDSGARTGRQAEGATLAVVAAAIATLIGCEAAALRTAAAIAPTVILALGGIGAFVQTYLVWRGGGRWRIWHAAGWVLFLLMTLCAAFGASSLMTT